MVEPAGVALVNMPFAPATRPSIQLGILGALLEEAAIPCSEHYASVDFYDRLRVARALSQYTALSPSMVSEWYFSERPFDPRPDGADAEAVERLRQHGRDIGFSFDRMREIREKIVPPFLEDTAKAVAATNPRIVCFTLSYAQINASFALARRLKELVPGVVTIFGGAGSQVFEDACREYMTFIPVIDFMVLGEAELVFVELVRRIVAEQPVDELPNVMYREDKEIKRSSGKAESLVLDQSPIPRYDGYFEVRDRMPRETRRDLDPVLLMEIGRGCTWGDELTCKFCAFIFHGKYRGKSRQRVVDETVALARRYKRKSFYLVDDIVTNNQITDILPAMKQAVPGMLVQFMEMRTATTKRHVKLLADSGVCMVQPGTENFDDGLLKKISKGTTAFHNIQFLKWAKEAAVRVSHNVLLNVPGATRDEVETQLHVVRRLSHLDPPFAFPIQLVRFSPYHANPEENGVGRLLADPFYRWLFPEGLDIEKVAYMFIEENGSDPHADVHLETMRAVANWQARWGRLPLPYLCFERDADGLTILDGRPLGAPLVHRFDALTADIHGCLTDCPLNEEGVLRALRESRPELRRETVTEILEHLTALDVTLKLRGRWLSLAVEADAVRRSQPVPTLEAVTA